MRTSLRSLRFAAALLALTAAAGCLIQSQELAGSPCETRDQCLPETLRAGDDVYDCIVSDADAGTKTCQVIYPPQKTPQDGGTDGGGVPTVYWCDGVDQLMIDYCGACHGEDRSASGQPNFRVDIYEDVDGGAANGGLDGAKTKAQRIKFRTSDIKTMPPFGSPQPTDAERALVSNWVLSGAKLCADGGM